MTTSNWVEVAVRIIDYCQTRDAFLRSQEATPEMVQMWADELSKTRQSEPFIQQAAARAYRKAEGKPPADPLGAVVAEIRTMTRDQASVDWKEHDLGRTALGPSEQSSDGPVPAAYRCDDAIKYWCRDHTAKRSGKKYRGCRARPGEYCRRADGRPRKTPCTARLVQASDQLTEEQYQERCMDGDAMQNSYITNPQRFGRSA